jgi:pimeloyl-ACP methyl ester carboxylesterase
VLLASTAYDQRLPPFAWLAVYPRLSALLFRAAGPTLLTKFVLKSVVHDVSAVDAEFVRGYSQPLRAKAALPALIAAARQIRPRGLAELSRRYCEIRVPTLLLWGRHDRVVPLWVAERLAKELPSASLHVLEACGHLPAEERPGESYSILEAFLDGRPGPKPD